MNSMKKLFTLLLATGITQIHSSVVKVTNNTPHKARADIMYRSCPPVKHDIAPFDTQSIQRECLIMDVKAFVTVKGEQYGTAATGKNTRTDSNGFAFGARLTQGTANQVYSGSGGTHTFEITGSLETGFRLEQK